MKTIKKGSVKKSSSSPTATGTKPIMMAAPQSTKTADNVTNRTAKMVKKGK